MASRWNSHEPRVAMQWIHPLMSSLPDSSSSTPGTQSHSKTGLQSIPQPIMLRRHSDRSEPLRRGEWNFEPRRIRSATELWALLSVCPRSGSGA
jgi:hypothetical protein